MRKAILAIVLLALAVPVLAQEDPGDVPRPKEVVTRVLALTPEQVTEWEGMLDTLHATVEPLATQLRDVEEQLKTLLAEPNPDPTQVGTLVLQGKGLRDQIRDAREAYLDAFEAMLTVGQKGKLGFVRRADRIQPAIPAFRLFGLLPPPDAPAGPPPTDS